MNPRAVLDVWEENNSRGTTEMQTPTAQPVAFCRHAITNIFARQITHISFLNLLVHFPNYLSHAHPAILQLNRIPQFVQPSLNLITLQHELSLSNHTPHPRPKHLFSLSVSNFRWLYLLSVPQINYLFQKSSAHSIL
jgi:hypothetical protein